MKENINIDAVIQAVYPAFTKTEKKIADYFLSGQLQGMTYTLEELSKEIGVSPSSVMRFAHKCGYSSLRSLEFDISNAHYLKKIISTREYAGSAARVFNNLHQQLTICENALKSEDVAETARKLAKADVVICLGEGYSAYTAELVSYMFLRSGIFSVTHTSVLRSNEAYIMGRKNAVVLAFSVSGETDFTVRTAEVYSRAGSPVISFTNGLRSKLARMSDCIFFTPTSTDLTVYKNTLSSDAEISAVSLCQLILSKYLEIRKGDME